MDVGIQTQVNGLGSTPVMLSYLLSNVDVHKYFSLLLFWSLIST